MRNVNSQDNVKEYGFIPLSKKRKESFAHISFVIKNKSLLPIKIIIIPINISIIQADFLILFLVTLLSKTNKRQNVKKKRVGNKYSFIL